MVLTLFGALRVVLLYRVGCSLVKNLYVQKILLWRCGCIDILGARKLGMRLSERR